MSLWEKKKLYFKTVKLSQCKSKSSIYCGMFNIQHKNMHLVLKESEVIQTLQLCCLCMSYFLKISVGIMKVQFHDKIASYIQTLNT